MKVVAHIRNRITVHGATTQLTRAVLSEFRHKNPEHAKKKSLGLSVFGVPTHIETASVENGGAISVPRGGLARLARLLKDLEFDVRWVDQRERGSPVSWPSPRFELRPYQADAVVAVIDREQGIVRAPTGSGKTLMALAAAARTGTTACVVIRDRQLLEQWKNRAVEQLGLVRGEVGVVGAGRKKAGKRLTLAMQQTLWSPKFDLDRFAGQFGAVVVDECHAVGARTVQHTIDRFPARYRIGFSADERRKDRKDFLVYDVLGDVLVDVDRAELEARGDVLPVTVRLVPTDFRADWYADAPREERDFTRLVNQMVEDERRECVLRRAILDAVVEGPTFVFTHRKVHARMLADVWAFQQRVSCGLLLGGAENAQRFAEDRRRLEEGKIKLAVGTFGAIGQGIDMPAVARGVVATPIGNNPQFFGQVRGRMCRPGKADAILYWLWDRHVFEDAPRMLARWNDGRVEVPDGTGGWVRWK